MVVHDKYVMTKSTLTSFLIVNTESFIFLSVIYFMLFTFMLNNQRTTLFIYLKS